MAGLNDDAQWIVLMGFIVSFSLFFLALVINQSTLVGQTTAEAVLDFPKNDIRDARHTIAYSANMPDRGMVQNDLVIILLSRKGAVLDYTIIPPNPPIDAATYIDIHYNNGVSIYNETWTYV